MGRHRRPGRRPSRTYRPPRPARLALPTSAATYEPKRLRLRILAVAGRIVRTAQHRVLHIDPAYPWAEQITMAHTRLCSLPHPEHPLAAPQPGPMSTDRPR
ncbi:MAG: transposase [Actinobacteria bacterium]|nr:transposase [Actinomycetota bacterium]